MTRVLAGLAFVLAAIFAGGVAAVAAQPATVPLVPCGDVIEQQATGSLYGSRVVLGSVAVAPARIQRAAPTGSKPWTHFSKWGITIRRGVAAQVSVPPDWRNRVAITWGASVPTVSTLRFAACRLPGSRAQPWSGYAGGFYLKASTACVPLTITVRRRSRTVDFGIGRSCGSA